MPNIMVMDEGLALILPAYFTANTTRIKLFANNIVPTRSMNVGNFTEPASGGYASQPLSGANWSVYSADTPIYITYPEITFTFTSGLSPNPTVYGFFITNTDGSKALFAKLLDSAFTPTIPGDNLSITPILYAAPGVPT